MIKPWKIIIIVCFFVLMGIVLNGCQLSRSVSSEPLKNNQIEQPLQTQDTKVEDIKVEQEEKDIEDNNSDKPNTITATSGKIPKSEDENGNLEEVKKIYNPENDAELQAMIGEVHALRNDFTGQLETMMEEAKSEYRNLPKENRKTEITKMGLRYVKKASQMEKECDARMEEILNRMSKHLADQNYSTDLVKEIRKQYDAEKKQTKSVYMEKVKSVI